MLILYNLAPLHANNYYRGPVLSLKCHRNSPHEKAAIAGWIFGQRSLSKCTTFAIFLILELDRSIKRKSIGIQENADTTLRDWCFVINTVQFHFISDHI